MQSYTLNSTIFEIAGIKVQDRIWLSGVNNITYM